jgi:hypothetical protein
LEWGVIVPGPLRFHNMRIDLLNNRASGTARPTNRKPISLPDCHTTSQLRPTLLSRVEYKSNVSGNWLSVSWNESGTSIRNIVEKAFNE